MSDPGDTIREGAARFLEDGEEVIATLSASPRGRTTAMAAGGLGGLIGQEKMRRVHNAAEQAEIRIGSPMAIALTQRRLLTLKVGTSIAMGKVTEVKELLSAVPLSDVDSIEAKRFGMAGILTLTARGGAPIKLECRVAGARAFAEAFDRAKATG